MKTIPFNTLESEITNTLELSAICRGEWCRALENKVDVLGDELAEVSKKCSLSHDCMESEGAKISEMSYHITKSYNNLRGDFRL